MNLISFFIGFFAGVGFMIFIRVLIYQAAKLTLRKGEKLNAKSLDIASELDSMKIKINELWQQVDKTV